MKSLVSFLLGAFSVIFVFRKPLATAVKVEEFVKNFEKAKAEAFADMISSGFMDSQQEEPVDYASQTGLNMATGMNETVNLDRAIESENDVTEIDIHHIGLGDLWLQCPGCDSESNQVLVGIGTLEDREGESDSIHPDMNVNDLYTAGVIVFPGCGHMFHSSCLVNKVASILDAEESGHLRPGMFDNLLTCETHGNGE